MKPHNPLKDKLKSTAQEPHRSLLPKNKRKITGKKGLQEGYTRKTYVVKDEYIEKVESLAFLSDRKIEEIVNEAFARYFKDKKVLTKSELVSMQHEQ